MKDIITKYLDKSYKFTLSSYVSYHLVTKPGGELIRPSDVFGTLSEIFGIGGKEIEPIYDAWAENQAIKMSNYITDIRYKLYEKTGVELELTVFDLNRMIDLEEDDSTGLYAAITKGEGTERRIL